MWRVAATGYEFVWTDARRYSPDVLLLINEFRERPVPVMATGSVDFRLSDGNSVYEAARVYLQERGLDIEVAEWEGDEPVVMIQPERGRVAY